MQMINAKVNEFFINDKKINYLFTHINDIITLRFIIGFGQKHNVRGRLRGLLMVMQRCRNLVDALGRLALALKKALSQLVRVEQPPTLLLLMTFS